VVKAPVLEVLRNNWREVILTALLRTGQQVPFYIFTTYIITYGTQQLGFARGTILNFVMIQSMISVGTVVLMGYLSDIYGRRRITAIGCVAMIIFPFVYFGLLDTKSFWLVFIAIAVANPVQDIQYGPQAAFISECFPGSLRYSGSALGYQLASITAGGPAPIIALFLMRQFGSSLPIAIYISISAMISLACVYRLSEGAGHLDHQ